MVASWLVASATTAVPLRVVPCDSWSGAGLGIDWSLEASGKGLQLRSGELCIEAAASGPHAKSCDGSDAQRWRKIADGAGFQLQSWVDGRPLQAAVTQYSVGPAVLLANETETHWEQWLAGSVRWTSAETKKGLELRNHGGACCGDIFETRPTCLAVDQAAPCKFSWCDPEVDEKQRVSQLLKAMSLEEKAANMDSHNFGVPRLAVPPLAFGEALHGMVSGCGEAVDFGDYTSTGCPTSFPQVISLGASWNRSLWTKVGEAVSDEARGLHAQKLNLEAGLFLWSPNVNPFRDPRWGRGQEVASEEPLVCAEFGARYIKALEGAETTASGRKTLKTVATVKHFFDYDLEGNGPTDRQNVDVNVSARDQTEYFLPSFQTAVQEGKPHSMMCSYNAVNGVPACMHGEMINGKFRGDWGFDGFVVSDCDALSDGASTRYIQQKFNGSLTVQAQQALRGGTDLNCGALYGEQLVAAVQQGLVAESELDQALGRIYTQAVRLGLLDREASSAHGPKNVDTPDHRALAMEAALQGLVLLKNNDTLPLAPPKKLAILGPHGNGSAVFLGGPNYYGESSLVEDYTPLARARAQLPEAEVVFQQGCEVTGQDRSGLAGAVEAAKGADDVLLFLGLNSSIENEGKDRDSLELPGLQLELALQVAEAARRPITVVLVNGGPVAIRKLKESSKVGAILEAFFPGQFAAEAVLQTILGKASPAGLLPITVYDADFVSRRDITDLDLRDKGGITYRYFDGEPLWPFGFGMSYTSFAFSAPGKELRTSVAEALTTPLCFEVAASNTGDRPSDVVLLAFIQSDHADAPRNGKLCDFTREHMVQPGESRSAQLCVGKALSLVSDEGEERVLPGLYTISIGVKGSIGGRTAGSTIGTVRVTNEAFV